MAELEASYPDSAAIHRLARPAAELDVDQIQEILREFPRLPPLGSLRLADLVAKDVAAWVLLHDPELENLEPQLVARRLLFPTDYGESEWALATITARCRLGMFAKLGLLGEGAVAF